MIRRAVIAVVTATCAATALYACGGSTPSTFSDLGADGGGPDPNVDGGGPDPFFGGDASGDASVV